MGNKFQSHFDAVEQELKSSTIGKSNAVIVSYLVSHCIFVNNTKKAEI